MPESNATTMLPPKPPHQPWREIPLGTSPGTCRGHAIGGVCAQKIYWIVTENGARMPVSIAFEGARAPDPKRDSSQLDAFSGEAPTSEPEPGRGVSHYVDCVDRDLFERRNR